MIKLKQKITVSEGYSVFVSKSYFDHKLGVATVISEVLNNEGEVVKTLVDTYEKQEANTFWASFLDLQSLYDLTAAKHNLDVVDTEVEDILYKEAPVEEVVAEEVAEE